MSEVQELRERLGRVEDQLSRGTAQFDTIAAALDDIKLHLKRQDQVIIDTGDSVSGIVEMWESGVKGVQLACRVVKGWDWFIAQTLSKRGLALLALVLVIWRVLFDHWPTWLNYAVVIIKFIEGATL